MPRLRATAVYWNIHNKNCPMRPTFRMLILCFLTFGAVFLNSPGQGEIIDRIVAMVNDEIITLSELEEFRKSFYSSRSEENDWLDEEFDLLDLRHQALNSLIDEKLIDQEATRQKISVTEKQVTDTIESLRKEQGLSQSQLEMALRAQGLTYEAYKEQVEKGLKRTRLVNRVVKSKIEIKEEDLKTYYETHIKSYMTDESVGISHILLPLSTNPRKDQEDAVLSSAKDILKRAESGEDFAALPHQYSNQVPGIKGGDLGYFKRGEMIPAIDKKAFSLRVGEVGGPIRTPKGIILIKVTDRKGGNPIPLAKIRKRVEKDYYTSEVERRYREWLRKLRERSFIEVKL